jgi:hypothetical protein
VSPEAGVGPSTRAVGGGISRKTGKSPLPLRVVLVLQLRLGGSLKALGRLRRYRASPNKPLVPRALDVGRGMLQFPDTLKSRDVEFLGRRRTQNPRGGLLTISIILDLLYSWLSAAGLRLVACWAVGAVLGVVVPQPHPYIARMQECLFLRGNDPAAKETSR